MNPWFGVKQYAVSLENGETLVYGKSSPKGEGSYAYDFEVKDRAGLPATDTIIVGKENSYDIEGTSVKTGYFITDANSKGIRTVIFFAEYDRKDATIYIELAGNEKDGKQLSEKLSEALFNMIKSNAPDISAVKFELQ